MSHGAKNKVIAFLFLGFAMAISFAKAQTIDIVSTVVSSPAPRFTIDEKIKSAIELLKSSPPLLYATTGKNLKGNLVKKQIALAILNQNTGEIFEKRIWVKERDIKNFRKTGVMGLEPDDSGEGIDIEIVWWNSFNSFYDIVGRPDLIVIANKYLFPSKDLFNLPERSLGKYTDIVYVPYSRSLHLPDVIEAGKGYLEQKIDHAYGDLESRKVFSHSSPGTIVTAGISKDFIRNIILVEHIDPDGFNSSDDSGRELTERVLTIIGLNKNSAYRYTGSPAGASGLAQFIRPTYNTIVFSYPGAGLIKDYHLGMADHVNAIKAMVLFFDNRKQEINNKVTRRDILQSLGITEEMLAAAYNGGGNRVATSVNKFGMAWITSQLNLPAKRRIFKSETINYLKKFQAIKSLNLFANISPE